MLLAVAEIKVLSHDQLQAGVTLTFASKTLETPNRKFLQEGRE